ncbi:MAG: 50S ribosomal protein L15 [Candidatus Nealsonbacteria bacterium RBG_13_38_11]|uniref:Large ribosomal subunit protein uL15 n=1 Tax=Candidatus Nealsonbacteria bacterium RBG_13_38_11 TaxID=1801662 RepID=A0A1G2DZJ6_9BACT|nr:MAG: 50S ribosomal protein L15 [Candidatus Nealsonbacteria bacterium RBG_13_38_11]HXK32284.1 uL15 family ribosomal protein [Candidatus Paceibacterota bacterium]
MQLHELKPIGKLKKSKRVGRGGKRGTYSGKGMKGQRSRAGRRFQPAIRELIKRYPKLRGHHLGSKPKFKKPKPEILNLTDIEKKFKTGEKVSPQTLIEKGILHKISKRGVNVKILAKGEISRALEFENCLVSKTAKEKIEKAGGKINA